EILSTFIASDGNGADLMTIPAGGAARPATHETLDSRLHYMKIKGREVFKFVVTTLEGLVTNAVAKCGLTIDDVALLIPHQMNLRIIESAVERLGFPLDKVAINIDRYGNTSAASIPLALDEVSRNGRLKKGDIIVMASFGGGLTWSSAVVRW
ncbi:MAG: 3-oxoacyl-[acyl-carrier-protein] synthase III C-terminal domain-containing protein, partial [Planctomycetota bacterium]|nr:3-oxoacyl-[acyl-carrier-protein] synthase III C-terminal domain-containing protein [Planctomycetota bacterium]